MSFADLGRHQDVMLKVTFLHFKIEFSSCTLMVKYVFNMFMYVCMYGVWITELQCTYIRLVLRFYCSMRTTMYIHKSFFFETLSNIA